ncbi:hypothetical protein E3T28_14190 [Cryobacterium sinapicolor]|uniref:Uncharacterized protein n=1 Tax=Cryobacterium sinapicolor TaxID=1259236 RepID=A0ABY2IXL5_9MICO|nr:hypothetical protein [Cryobacterium sinapicolor]TFC95086.1 hypothetical protein E3T28_14190 [Cryobacterium sinapicolor]
MLLSLTCSGRNSSIRPADGNEWPMVGRDLGYGAFAGTTPSRYMIEIEPVANTAMLTSAQGVRLRIDEEAEALPSVGQFTVPPPEQRQRSLAGWLVDVQEHT